MVGEIRTSTEGVWAEREAEISPGGKYSPWKHRARKYDGYRRIRMQVRPGLSLYRRRARRGSVQRKVERREERSPDISTPCCTRDWPNASCYLNLSPFRLLSLRAPPMRPAPSNRPGPPPASSSSSSGASPGVGRLVPIQRKILPLGNPPPQHVVPASSSSSSGAGGRQVLRVNSELWSSGTPRVPSFPRNLLAVGAEISPNPSRSLQCLQKVREMTIQPAAEHC